jgi:hypothetical protein
VNHKRVFVVINADIHTMEITIKFKPKDEYTAIEYARECVVRYLIPTLKECGFSPVKYSVKYKINKLKNHKVKCKRKNKSL